MSKIDEIISLTKCSVTLSINAHRDYYYDSVTDYLGDNVQYIDSETLKIMEKMGTLVTLTIYPDTPVGSLDFYGIDTDTVLEEALEYYREEGRYE